MSISTIHSNDAGLYFITDKYKAVLPFVSGFKH